MTFFNPSKWWKQIQLKKTESLSPEEYPGLKVKRLDHGYELTQPSLITKILQAIGMQESQSTIISTAFSGPLGYGKASLLSM